MTKRKSERKLLGVALALLALTAGAAESTLVRSVVAPERAPAGATIEVKIVALNSSQEDATVNLPAEIEARLGSSGQRPGVILRAKDSVADDQRIGPGKFAMRRYELTLPSDASAGLSALDVPAWGRAALEIALADESEAREQTEAAGVTKADEPATRRPPTNLVRAPAAAGIRRMFADRLAPHEPIYFVYGADAPAAKFQVSFKYKLLDFRDVAPQRMARTLHLAYTQRSLWDLGGVSSPFYDTSYMPELMYEALAPRPEDSERWFTWLGVQAAFKHESNGRDGPVSRSLNVVYARPVFAFGDLDRWHLLVIPEVFAYVGTLEDNTDIEEYRGHGRLSLVLGRNDGPSLMATLWAGDEFQHGTVQLDLTVPIRTRLLDFETYLLVQYFNGYGESLLSYDEEVETVRAGISLVR